MRCTSQGPVFCLLGISGLLHKMLQLFEGSSCLKIWYLVIKPLCLRRTKFLLGLPQVTSRAVVTGKAAGAQDRERKARQATRGEEVGGAAQSSLQSHCLGSCARATGPCGELPKCIAWIRQRQDATGADTLFISFLPRKPYWPAPIGVLNSIGCNEKCS